MSMKQTAPHEGVLPHDVMVATMTITAAVPLLCNLLRKICRSIIHRCSADGGEHQKSGKFFPVHRNAAIQQVQAAMLCLFPQAFHSMYLKIKYSFQGIIL